uniref:BTB domain-containing protein n=1 Tax=Oryzias latipes TaxID=8090 RepID=A0A3B3I8V4_ORYLA
ANGVRKDGEGEAEERRISLSSLIVTPCDVTLVVQGRKHFPARRIVLAAASHFFSRMFTTRMRESMSHEVELRSVELEIIELLIDFIYTARISVNNSNSNVQSLLDAANQYQIEPVKKMCVEFLKGQIDPTNCLGISALADCMDCPELKSAAEDFFQLHFTEVYKLDEFLELDVSQLTHLLHQDELTVRSEDQIYDAAVRWLKYDMCNRQQYMVEVLECDRFPRVQNVPFKDCSGRDAHPGRAPTICYRHQEWRQSNKIDFLLKTEENANSNEHRMLIFRRPDCVCLFTVT